MGVDGNPDTGVAWLSSAATGARSRGVVATSESGVACVKPCFFEAFDRFVCSVGIGAGSRRRRQGLGRECLLACRGQVDSTFFHQVLQTLIQGLHAGRAPGLNGRIYLCHLVFPDEIADCRRAQHDFVSRQATAAGLSYQYLRHYGLQGFCQQRAYLILFRAGEYIHDAMDGLGCRRRVQGAEHQVPGLCRGQRQGDGFPVAQLAYQDDVRVFAQGCAQSGVEAAHVTAHFPLGDQAILAFVNELDGILDGQDVFLSVGVDVIEKGCKAGALARSGRTRHADQSCRKPGNVAEHRGHLQFFHGWYLRRNGAHHDGGAALLVQGVDPESGQSGDLEGKIRILPAFMTFELLRARDGTQGPQDFPVRQWGMFDSPNLAINPHEGWQTCGNVQIRGSPVDSKGQKLENIQPLLSFRQLSSGSFIIWRWLSCHAVKLLEPCDKRSFLCTI